MGRVQFEIVKNSAVLVDISDDDYFGKYKDYISNSRLSLINPEENGSNKKFIEGIKSSYSPYFNLGTAFHASILQPDSYEVSENLLPEGVAGEIIMELVGRNDFGIESICNVLKSRSKAKEINEDYILKKALSISNDNKKLIEYIQEEVRSGKKKLYLTGSLIDKLSKCISSFNENEKFMSLISPDDKLDFTCMNEITIMVDVKASFAGKETILHLKGKIDNLKMNDASYVINDLKTSFHGKSNFSSSVSRFHYQRQAVFYKFLVDSYLSSIGEKKKFKSFNFLFTSTSDFSTGVYKMNKNDFENGKKEFLFLLELAAIAQMFEQNKGSIEYYNNVYSLNIIACSYTEKFKLITLLLFLLQQFRKKDKNFTFSQMIEKIRKDKCKSTSVSLYERLEAIVESEYDETENYPTFKMTSAKEMAAYINGILDREMPFSNKSPWIFGDDLPF